MGEVIGIRALQVNEGNQYANSCFRYSTRKLVKTQGKWKDTYNAVSYILHTIKLESQLGCTTVIE